LQASGLPAAISNTAGTYLCNNVMYMALYYAHEFQPNMQCGFIHIPASHELAIQHGGIPSWSHEDLKKGISICVEALSSDE
jgi:pyroglutamyl-peptidase